MIYRITGGGERSDCQGSRRQDGKALTVRFTPETSRVDKALSGLHHS